MTGQHHSLIPSNGSAHMHSDSIPSADVLPLEHPGVVPAAIAKTVKEALYISSILDPPLLQAGTELCGAIPVLGSACCGSMCRSWN